MILQTYVYNITLIRIYAFVYVIITESPLKYISMVKRTRVLHTFLRCNGFEMEKCD